MMDCPKRNFLSVLGQWSSHLSLSNCPHCPDQHTNQNPNCPVSIIGYMDNYILNIDVKSALSAIIPYGVILYYQTGYSWSWSP